MLRPRAPRADAPAAREVGLAEAARGGAAVRVRCGAGPEHVPGVRNDVGDEALAAVERLRIKGPVGHPERALEFLSDLLGASGELGGPRRVALRDDLGERAHRLDRVCLHLDRRQRALGPPALRVQVAVAGVLPDLVGDPGRSLALELDEEVAVEIAALFHPFERGADARLEISDEIALGHPARGLGREPHEERRRVDRAVVRRAEGAAGPHDLALPDLVRDPSGLLVALGHVARALVVGELSQHRGREVAAQRQRHQGGHDRVASERRDEPGDARGGKEPIRGLVREHEEIERAARDPGVEVGRVARELRRRPLPRIPVAIGDDGGRKRRVDADVDLDRAPVAGRDPDRDAAAGGTVARLPRVDRRQQFGRLLHTVDGGVPKQETMTVGGRGLAVALRDPLPAAHLEQIAEVGVDRDVGLERRVAGTGVLYRPLVLDRVLDADAPCDLQAI